MEDFSGEVPVDVSGQTLGTSFILTLSSKVTIQKRVVYDIFMMFGDVGGLYDFIIISFTSLFGFWSEHFMRASLV